MQQQDLIIGVDAGTSVIKAVAFDREGQQLGLASTPNRVLYGAHGAAEQDMDRTWADTAATLRLLAQQVPDLAGRSAALVATAQGDGTWLIDAAGRPVGPAMLWLDARAAGEVAALRASAAAAPLAERTGAALNASMQSGQLLWLRRHAPQRLARATTALHCKDWLYFQATGVRSTCNTEAIFTFGNYRSGAYDEEVLALLGLPELARLLPPIVTPGSAHAPLTRAAAQDTGLRAGTPVVPAPMDVPATLLGCGGIAYGPQGLLRSVGCSVLGSTGMHGWASTDLQAIRPSAEAGYTMLMPLPGVCMRLMSHMAATLNIDWLLGLLAQAAEFAGAPVPARAALLERLDHAVLAAAPGQAIFHPYVAENGERGPFVDPCARAQLSGFGASLGLSGLARAVYEGIVFAARDCYAAFGPIPEEIRLAGGAARSPALRQLLANATGRPVRVSRREECGAAGAALLAAVAIGEYASLRDALPRWVDSHLDAHVTAPDPAQTALYDRLFPLYQQAAARSRPLWAALGALRSGTSTGLAGAAPARSPPASAAATASRGTRA
ncbi:FGGY-family carbohydrate kinase [Verminephrobacter aporrectodeae]|uniref:FGGY-family carbohydrate kinase n=1 Tax=Verminephrobacter aporrectodeae TaxID=1110389 RepID=UPI0022441583|nr:FGGY-family carbohydrate kinase [Verminephrobacter aporrectodeae]MCW8164909.1 carbohydrate kinase [Verminephrobacter aporrectodeae subsp. tuberculatae]MCW8168616.1 carbohydrate kinase [Verminephrobacter aporrectodeae subsp. tuberculatae]MCW8174431.1 carbohydrate kinase [Verminephrobacter aporrectodeae subsp. tuberculatae]MCW8201770.1 carbohydrate kinase [Verminephrobacter aporrectodeae subsp. tuberculatae]